MTSTQVQDELVAECLSVVLQAISDHARVPAGSIDPDGLLSDVPGIESVKALRAITQVEDALGVLIPDDFLFETATVRELAAQVASLREQDRQ